MIAIVEKNGLGVVTVRTVELAAPVVETHAVLGAATFRAKVECFRVEREVATTKVDRRLIWPVGPTHDPARSAGGTVDAVIQSPTKAVDEPLHVRAFEPRKDGLPLVGLQVAVGVLNVIHIRSGSDEDATVVAENGRRPGELLGAKGAFVEATVVVCVYQQSKATQDRLVQFGVITHFDDVQPPVLIKRHGHRVGHQRFVGCLLDSVTGQRLERLHRLVWFQGGNAGQFGRKVDSCCRSVIQIRIDEAVSLHACFSGEVVVTQWCFQNKLFCRIIQSVDRTGSRNRLPNTSHVEVSILDRRAGKERAGCQRCHDFVKVEGDFVRIEVVHVA